MYFNAIGENKIIAKISGFTVCFGAHWVSTTYAFTEKLDIVISYNQTVCSHAF